MSPVSTRVVAARAVVRSVLLAGLIVVGAACAAPRFDPSGACTADGRAPGAYPALEALVPHALGGRPADSVDSGRNCTPASLGALAGHGVKELRFAGATWGSGPNAGTSIAIFEAPGLRADWVHEFFRAGAEAARDAESVDTSTPTVKGEPAFRVDALNGESYQTAIDWQDGDRVRVVLVASFIREVSTKARHEARVQAAIDAIDS
jgi:hypothetical protein